MTSRRNLFLRITPWTVILAYAGLFLEIPYSNVLIAIMLICCLFSLTLKDLLSTLRSNVPVQLLILFFLLHIPGLLYTENMQLGFFELEKKLTLLLFPLVVFPVLQQYSEKEKSDLQFRIGVVTLLSGLVFLSIALFKKYGYQDELAFHRDYFATIPYVYYAIYFATGSLLILHSIYDRWKSHPRVWLAMLVVIFFSIGIMVIIASKTGLIAFLAGIVFLLFKNLPSRKWFGLGLVGVTIAISAFLYAHPVALERFIEIRANLGVLKKDTLTDYEEFTGLNLRLYFWKISLNRLWDEKRIAGVGTGDGQDYLDETYRLHNLDDYGYLGYDAHNQWVMTLIQLGLVGFLTLAAVFITGWRAATGSSGINFRLFSWVFVCFSLSESVLEANKGIVFFALLFCVLGCSFQPKKQQ